MPTDLKKDAETGHFRVLAGAVVGLSEDEFYKPRFGIVQNLDVSEELWAGQLEKGLDVELDLSVMVHTWIIGSSLACENQALPRGSC